MEMKSIILSTPLANSPPPPPSWQSTQSQSQCLPNRFTRVEELKIQSKILAGWPAGFKNTTELLEVQKPLGREEVDVREGMRSQEVVGNPFSHTQNSTSSPDQNNSKIERMAITSILSNSSHPESERHNGGCLPTATRQLGPLATGSLENASSNKRGPLDWKAIYHSQRQTTETCREQTNGRRRRGANLDWTDEERLLVKKLFDSDNPLRKVKEAYDKRFPGKNRSKEAIRRAHSRLKGKKTKKLPDKLLSPPKSTQVAYQAPSDVVLPSTATPSPETSKKAWLKRQLATMSDVHSESQISVSKNTTVLIPGNNEPDPKRLRNSSSTTDVLGKSTDVKTSKRTPLETGGHQEVKAGTEHLHTKRVDTVHYEDDHYFDRPLSVEDIDFDALFSANRRVEIMSIKNMLYAG